MPGDLRDQEQSIPYHYDSRYEPGLNTFESGSPEIKKELQKIVLEKGIVLSPERMDDLILYLDEKGKLGLNRGDEPFRDEVFKYLDKITKARKVASKWLT
jgi:hypothetical protein